MTISCILIQMEEYQPEFGVFNPMAGDPMQEAFQGYVVPNNSVDEPPQGLLGRFFRRSSKQAEVIPREPTPTSQVPFFWLLKIKVDSL